MGPPTAWWRILQKRVGKRLADDLGDGYFAIGTDARITTFNSQTDDGFTETTAQNKNSLNALAGSVEGARYYMDLTYKYHSEN